MKCNTFSRHPQTKPGVGIIWGTQAVDDQDRGNVLQNSPEAQLPISFRDTRLSLASAPSRRSALHILP